MIAHRHTAFDVGGAGMKRRVVIRPVVVTDWVKGVVLGKGKG